MTRQPGVSALGLLFLLFAAHSIGMSGQATSANDDSDWWSILRSPEEPIGGKFQQREIANANFRITGVFLRDYSLEAIERVMGVAPTTGRGDASTGREQACYVSSDAAHPTYLIFEQGEVNAAFYLFSETTPWNGRNLCVSSKRVSTNVRTNSGLHLAQTPEEVVKILGEPSERRGDALYYLLHVEKKTPPDQFARVRAQHPELSEKQLHDDYDRYDLTVFICAKFRRSSMVYLAVSVAETS